MPYTSQYTGSELDETIRLTLGGTYRGDTGPGCHLIGDKVDMPQNLNDLSIPGKYTAYFFYNGPTGVNNVISPICVQVYWAGQFLYQTITIGTKFYWRDLISGDLSWKMIDMGVEATKVVDDLYTDIEYDESADEMALSANMGAELRKMTENQEIGNVNLLDCTGELHGYTGSDGMTLDNNYWVFSNSAININSELPVYDVSNGSKLNSKSFYVNKNGYVMSYGSYIKGYSEFMDPYTASVYVKNINASVDSIPDSDIMYIKIIIKDVDAGVADIVFTREYRIKDYINTTELNNGKLRLSVTINKEIFGERKIEGRETSGISNGVATKSTRTIHVCFGFNSQEGPISTIEFYHPKLEYGYYATAYNHSANDLRYWYTNCEKIYDAPINATSPNDFIEQDGLVYNSTTKAFIHEAVAVGGGGGFVTCNNLSELNTNARRDKVLAFVLPTEASWYDRTLYCIDPVTKEWFRTTNPSLVAADCAVDGYYPSGHVVPSTCGWLDTSKETAQIPATLNYYSSRYGSWRTIGAMPTQIWILQENPPTDVAQQQLIWIKSSTMAPYICVNGEWRPLLTIWGAST